jgi:NADPH:quinone reductase-like Zn-dependent oxidoreductase
VDLLEVTAGQQVVVMGATGGVGGYAVQIARSRGAHVIATVRGDADEARRLGAEEAYNSQANDVIDALRAAHPAASTPSWTWSTARTPSAATPT